MQQLYAYCGGTQVGTIAIRLVMALFSYSSYQSIERLVSQKLVRFDIFSLLSAQLSLPLILGKKAR